MENNTYELLIIGGGPGGVSAGVYAARKRIKTALVTESFGGQSIESEGIQNWIGTINISGLDLAKAMETHLRAYASDVVNIMSGKRVRSLEKNGDNFKATTETGEEIIAKTVLVTAGSTRRKLDIPGSREFENKGITYCASCDGPLYSDSDVVVVGGGNAGFESAAQLAAYCKKVYILHKNESFKADEVTVEKVLSKENVAPVLNAEITSVEGDKFVTAINYRDKTTGTIVKLPVSGVFVEIGLLPQTSFLGEIAEKNQIGQIIVDPKTQRSKTLGIWAAGDCTDGLYHQNNIASGDAVKALEDIYLFLNAQ
jgi:alkyl hydroperoxide reductase subunit F